MKKKNLAGFLMIIMAALLANPALTQEIVSVTPSSGFVGETAYPVIVCNNTQLVSDFDYIEIGDPALIQVLSAEVINNFELEVIIDISPFTEPDEFRDITIYLNNGSSIHKENAFLTKAAGDFEVMLTVIHVDPLYLSAFDPAAPQNSPLLFTVQFMNEWKNLDNARVEFIVENPDYGELGTAEKFYETGIPKGLPYLVFDNRDFDEYEINSDALELLDEAMQTGLLPAGVYNYYINVYSNDSLIGQDQGANVTSNLLTAIDLIGPGSPVGGQPPVVFSPAPYFQWFSSATSFDFTLYEVMEGQYSPDEITSNLPEFEETGLGTSELLYPGYAEILVPGKTYAWQVKAYFDGSMGVETIYSEVFWFQYESGGISGFDHIEIYPDGSIVNVSESAQYNAIGFDQFNNPQQINPNWQVVPSSAGTIDENGLFTAGSDRGVAAIVASYAGFQEYTTVLISEIVPSDFEFGMPALANDMFCLDKHCENDVYISKQTEEYWPDCDGVGTKTTDRYEHGCVTITNTGPIHYGVIPNDFCIGTSTTKSWEGWGHPDIDLGPSPGKSLPASLILDYDVHYSRPTEFPGGVEIPCGVINSEVVEGGYSCNSCGFHLPDGGNHDLIHKTGTITVNFIVHSIKIEVPSVCTGVGKQITVNAETYPIDMGEVTWETQDNDLIIHADNKNATIMGNKPGVYTIIAKLNIHGVTYKSEFTVTVCEVDLITKDPEIFYKKIGLPGEREYSYKDYIAKVLPEGTEANVSVRFGDVKLDKTHVTNGDKITARIKDNTKYGLRITHECNDNIFKDVGNKDLSVIIKKTEVSINKETGLLTIKCSATGSPAGGDYHWNIKGISKTGKNITYSFNRKQWDIKEGEEISVSVTYIKGVENASDETTVQAPPILSVEITKVRGRTNKRRGKVTIDCEAEGLPKGGIYTWEIGERNARGKKVHIVLDRCDWDALGGRIPIKVKYTVAGMSVTDRYSIQVAPLKFHLTLKKRIRVNKNRHKKRLTAVFRPAGCEVKWIKSGDCIQKKRIWPHLKKSHYIFDPIKRGKATITAELYYCDEFITSKECIVIVR
jgi:hypothetical protein